MGMLKKHLTSNMTCVYSVGNGGSSPPSDKKRFKPSVLRIKSHNNNNESDKKTHHLRFFEQTPSYLQHNPYIRTGYRVFLSTTDCFRSLFWWTNETLNIWTHVFGFVLFLGILLYDIFVVIPVNHPSFGDIFFMITLLTCYMLTMILSVAYHTFLCHSEKAYYGWLQWDIAGVILSFAAIFMSGIHYAFACFPRWRTFYQTVAFTLSFVMLCSHFASRSNVRYGCWRLTLFFLWAIFGVVPAGHWAILEGGIYNPVIQQLLPRVGVMYVLVGIAFLFYISRFPEKCCPGKMDYVGASHQLWHLVIVAAMWWWHETGLHYAIFRQNYSCDQEISLRT